jgi:hypothetical protein
MKRSLAVVGVLMLPLFAGCVNIRKTSLNTPVSAEEVSKLTALTTAELEARHVGLNAEIVEIEHEVELKAGLHMGVFISDERTRLAELLRESEVIERELVRRGAYPNRESLRAKL